MSHKKTNRTHNGEQLYKIPFVEHEYSLYRESKIRNRIVKALIITNAAWLFAVAFITSAKK